MPKHKSQLITLFLLLTCLSSATFAQNTTSRLRYKGDRQVITKKKADLSKFELTAEDVLPTAISAGFYSDTAAALQTLPGVVSAGDFDANMYVRGGTSQEVLTVIDQTQLPFPYLFGGRVSRINPKLIEDITFYAGGFPAEYGNVLSAVVDVDYKKGDLQEFSAELDTGLAELNYLAQGPLQKGKSSWLFGVRKTYIDLVFAQLLPAGTEFPGFTQYYSKLFFKLSPKHELSVINEYIEEGANITEENYEEAFDEAAENSRLIYDSEVWATKFNLESRWNRSFRSITSLEYTTNFVNGNFGGQDTFNRNSDFGLYLNRKPLILGMQNIYTGIKRHRIKGGFYGFTQEDETRLTFGTGTNAATNSNTASTFTVENRERLRYLGYYLQDEINIIPKKLAVNIGARMDNGIHAKTPRAKAFQPRAIVYLGDRKKSAWTVSVGKYASLEYPDYSDLVPPTALHYNLGYQKTVNNDWLFRVETYRKNYKNLFREIRDNALDNNLRGYDNNRTGHAEGLEIFFQKYNHDRLNGYISYTYSVVEYTDDIYGTFNPDHDLRHSLKLSGNYVLSDFVKLFINATVQTGLPYNDITGGNFDRVITDLNGDRLPGYQTIDVWFELQKAYPLPFVSMKGRTYVGVKNLLNRVNVYGYDWNSDFSQKEAQRQLPILPFIGVVIAL